ncbi:MAG: hypothetical protein E6767_10945 [Dysgonomonas sp.]|nr:hypothetical protein [Dysgonomonas sp.]
MKQIYFIAVILISILLFSCSGGTTSPRTFNNDAIKIFSEASKVLDEFDSKITAGVKSNDLASIEIAANSALEKVDTQTEKMQAINVPQNGEEYKDAVLKSLGTVKELIEIGRKYSALKEGYSKREFNALEKEYNNKRKQLSVELKDVGKAQSQFMKASGMK